MQSNGCIVAYIVIEDVISNFGHFYIVLIFFSFIWAGACLIYHQSLYFSVLNNLNMAQPRKNFN